MFTEAVQAIKDLRRKTGGQFFPTVYVAIGIDLNLHDQISFFERRPDDETMRSLRPSVIERGRQDHW
jgi:hypothetical protein